MPWEVRFFQTARGDYPVKEFIEGLEKKTYARVLKSITILCNFGPFIRMPYSKKISANLYELWIKGAESVRIFYTNVGEKYFLVHAFKKKSQKIPPKELKIALDRIQNLI